MLQRYVKLAQTRVRSSSGRSRRTLRRGGGGTTRSCEARVPACIGEVEEGEAGLDKCDGTISDMCACVRVCVAGWVVFDGWSRRSRLLWLHV